MMDDELRGQRVLIVEDNGLAALVLEWALTDLGANVIGTVGNVRGALDQVRQGGVHAALLEIRVAGQDTYELADLLVGLGVPTVFVTSYDTSQLPGRLAVLPYCQKPTRPKVPLALLRRAMRTTPLQSG